jgi:hypothetical protein
MLTRKPLRSRRVTPLLLGAFLAAGVGAAGLPAVGRAGDCDGCCSNHHCPPPYVHCMERPPCIKFKCACPRPVCPPCNAEFWGYYPTCWRRWPAMFSNCPERNPPWVAVAPPGMPAGFSESLTPHGETAPTTTVPAPMPPATGTPPAPPVAPPREQSDSWQPTTPSVHTAQWEPAGTVRVPGSSYMPGGEPGLLLLPSSHPSDTH